MSESTERAAPPARRPQVGVDDERDAPSDDLMCRVENAEGYGCTRVSGHRGDHIARSSPHAVCARWPAHPFVTFDPAREVAVILPREVAGRFYERFDIGDTLDPDCEAHEIRRRIGLALAAAPREEQP